MHFPAKIAACLWFDRQAEEAANFYVSIFKNSRVTNVARYTQAGHEIHGRQPGSVMTVTFELDGVPFTALNAGPRFKFNEAVSLQVFCDTQDEIDHFWTKLGAGGDPKSQQCGWLKDKFGLSWQIVPKAIPELLSSDDAAQRERVMTAVLRMKKIDLAEVELAAAR